MKKTYSTPVATASDVVRSTLGALINAPRNETAFSSPTVLGFGL